MRHTRSIVLVLLPWVLAACGSPSGPNGLQPHRALYAAALTLDGRVGAFEVRTGARTVDVLAAGGLVEIVFQNDRGILGRLYVPPGVLGDEAVDLRIDGTWRVEEERLRLAPRTGTFLEEIAFEMHGSRLTAEATVDGRTFTIEMVSVARADPTLVEFEFTPFTATAELQSIPGRGSVARISLRNRTGRDLAVLVGPCPAAFVRAFPEADPERPVWDQGEHLGCRERRRLALVDAGGSFHVDTALFNASHVALRGQPAARYEFLAVFPVGDEEITAHAGSIIMFST